MQECPDQFQFVKNIVGTFGYEVRPTTWLYLIIFSLVMSCLYLLFTLVEVVMGAKFDPDE